MAWSAREDQDRTDHHGTDVVRQALRSRNKKLNLANFARDLGMPSGRLDDFAERRTAAMQGLVRALWGEHTVFDPELNVLRPASREAPRPLGILPPPIEARPFDFTPVRRPIQPRSR